MAFYSTWCLYWRGHQQVNEEQIQRWFTFCSYRCHSNINYKSHRTKRQRHHYFISLTCILMSWLLLGSYLALLVHLRIQKVFTKPKIFLLQWPVTVDTTEGHRMLNALFWWFDYWKVQDSHEAGKSTIGAWILKINTMKWTEGHEIQGRGLTFHSVCSQLSQVCLEPV